jgi:hypothetical protein
MTAPIFSHCCHRGKVILAPLPAPPSTIRSLLSDQTTQARHFHRHIWQYNCCFAFTSFCSNDNNIYLNGRGPWMWKTGYQIYHSAGTLLPADGEQPSYAQLYFYDADDVLNHRKRRNPNLRREIIDSIQQCFSQSNPFSHVFLNAHNILQQQHVGSLAVHIVADPEKDHRRYNTPTVDEIAVVIVGNDQQSNDGRDIILRPRDGGLQQISNLHSAYAPLHYVLLFPLGTPEWNPSLKLRPPTTK